MTDWIVVLEYAPGPGAEWIELGAVEALVERLREWHPSALYNPDRYALHLAVEARGAAGALRTALSQHEAAAGEWLPPGWDLAVAEVHTADEFDRAVREANQIGRGPGSRLPPEGASEGASEAVAVYDASRRIRLVTTRSEATGVLADFITALGARVEVASEGDHAETAPRDAVVLDLSLGGPAPVFAVAEPGTTTRLVLDYWLPTLVEDVHRQLRSPTG